MKLRAWSNIEEAARTMVEDTREARKKKKRKKKKAKGFRHGSYDPKGTKRRKNYMEAIDDY